jgi:transposase InsO family protein
MALTSVLAVGVNTVEWLAAVTTVAVPVYQRHYRWDVDRCSRLLEDILHTHWVLVVMDQCTRRIVGFGVHRGVVDGVALCQMFNRAIRRQRAPQLGPSSAVPIPPMAGESANP